MGWVVPAGAAQRTWGRGGAPEVAAQRLGATAGGAGAGEVREHGGSAGLTRLAELCAAGWENAPRRWRRLAPEWRGSGESVEWLGAGQGATCPARRARLRPACADAWPPCRRPAFRSRSSSGSATSHQPPASGSATVTSGLRPPATGFNRRPSPAAGSNRRPSPIAIVDAIAQVCLARPFLPTATADRHRRPLAPISGHRYRPPASDHRLSATDCQSQPAPPQRTPPRPPPPNPGRPKVPPNPQTQPPAPSG